MGVCRAESTLEGLKDPSLLREQPRRPHTGGTRRSGREQGVSHPVPDLKPQTLREGPRAAAVLPWAVGNPPRPGNKVI